MTSVGGRVQMWGSPQHQALCSLVEPIHPTPELLEDRKLLSEAAREQDTPQDHSVQTLVPHEARC